MSLPRSILSTISALMIAAAVAAQPPNQPPAKFRSAAMPLSGRYIVRMADTAGSVRASSTQLAATHAGQVLHVFDSIPAFVVAMSDSDAHALAQEPLVAYVEEDSLVTADTTQTSAPWGLDRIDQRALPLSNTYSYTLTGAGVHAYVIDSGILPTHAEFGGRASVAVDYVNDGQNGIDCYFHGTYVSGILGGATFGVAKGVTLHGVRVLGCAGTGAVSDAIAGIDWVTANHIKPAVANMSMTANSASQAMDDAIAASVRAGVTYVVAAANNATDACLASPARAPEAITIGATESTDSRASYSNYGTCVDLFAPGSNIQSASITSNTATTTASGTSAASPHAAGAAALYLQANPSALPPAVASALTSQATRGVISDAGAGSPNLLLYTAQIGSAPGPTELIVSGTFEPTVKGWTATGAAHLSTGGVQHEGIGYGYLAKANNASGALSQTIQIPAGTNPILSFWLNVTSDESSTTHAADRLWVNVMSTTGTVLQILATFSNLDKGATGAYEFKSGYSLAAFAGQTVRLEFSALTDAAHITAFRIDDVSVSTDAPAPVCCGLIRSGEFEPSVSGWSVTGAAHLSTGGVQQSGTGYAYLGKANSVTGTLTQSIAIPAGTAPALALWINVTSDDPSTTVASDFLYVDVLDATGILLRRLHTFTNLDKRPTGSYVYAGGYDLSEFAGRTIRLQFRIATDASLLSAFRIDGVALQ